MTDATAVGLPVRLALDDEKFIKYVLDLAYNVREHASTVQECDYMNRVVTHALAMWRTGGWNAYVGAKHAAIHLDWTLSPDHVVASGVDAKALASSSTRASRSTR